MVILSADPSILRLGACGFSACQNKHMTTKILGYEEYVQKLKTLKTPADIAAFVQELTVPAVESLKVEEKPDHAG